MNDQKTHRIRSRTDNMTDRRTHSHRLKRRDRQTDRQTKGRTERNRRYHSTNQRSINRI